MDATPFFFLVGNVLCKLQITEGHDFTDAFNMVRTYYAPRVGEYIGDGTEDTVAFYHLQPAPLLKSLKFLRDGFTVTNLEDVLKDVQKVQVSIYDAVIETLGAQRGPRSVPFYIEKLTGEHSVIPYDNLSH